MRCTLDTKLIRRVLKGENVVGNDKSRHVWKHTHQRVVIVPDGLVLEMVYRGVVVVRDNVVIYPSKFDALVAEVNRGY